MSRLLNDTIDLLQAALAEKTAAGAGRSYYNALRPFGVRASYIRVYGSSNYPEFSYSRVSPTGWEDVYRSNDVDDANYLPREVKRRSTPFAWSDIHLVDPKERKLARLLIDNGFPDGLAIPCHGANGYCAVVSLAFERMWDFSPAERAAIELSSLVLHSRMQALTPRSMPKIGVLTVRERDCLALIADGKTDDQIAAITNISRNTVITHVKNARRKLGVRTRAQAVAQALQLTLI